MESNQSFHYTYSAEQQEEIRAIRQKYLPPEENKMERLRGLHRSVYKKARAASITLGVVGSLVLGTGMSLCMTQLGDLVGEEPLLVGIHVGLVGMLLVALAYPLYNRVKRKEREKVAPEILRLSEELMQ